MSETGDTASRPIFERWLETVLARDLDGLMDLYAEDAVLESPLILMTLTDAASGILRGRSEIRPFFAAGLREAGNGLGRCIAPGRSSPTAGSPPGNSAAPRRRAIRSTSSKWWTSQRAASPITGSTGGGWGSGC
jgi:hypothetical protein